MKTTLILSSLVALLSTATIALVDAQQSCNGSPTLCDKSYSQVSYPTTHNSYAFIPGAAAANQHANLVTQLKDGIRAFMLDGHNPTGGGDGIELCHDACSLLDAGSLVPALQNITSWLAQNPNEVLTIFWENFDKIPAARYAAAYQASGIMQYVYTPTDPQNWPTLRDLIQSGKRVINFIDSFNDSSVPWLVNEYTYVFETAFENTNPNNWTCTVDRPRDQQRPMYVLNHFTDKELTLGGTIVDIPASGIANTTNADNLAQHAQQCQQVFSKAPNFIAVDFYEQGSNGKNVFSVTNALNGVPYTPTPLLASAGQSTGKNSGGMNGVDVRLLSVSVLVGALVSFLGF